VNDGQLLDAYSRAMVGVVEGVAPAVVGISFLKQPAPLAPGGSGGGSGVIIAPDGYILTNDPVVSGAMQLRVGMMDGTMMEARVVGINTVIIMPAQGIGFAIPSDTARYILSQLMTRGRVIRGVLGMAGRLNPLPRRFVRFHRLTYDSAGRWSRWTRMGRQVGVGSSPGI
jgi:S1-C subfamily serine protease